VPPGRRWRRRRRRWSTPALRGPGRRGPVPCGPPEVVDVAWCLLTASGLAQQAVIASTTTRPSLASPPSSVRNLARLGMRLADCSPLPCGGRGSTALDRAIPPLGQPLGLLWPAIPHGLAGAAEPGGWLPRLLSGALFVLRSPPSRVPSRSDS
jgi:hypothetical protein